MESLGEYAVSVSNQGGLLNIEIVPGVDLVLGATITTGGVPVDLTGHTFTGRVVNPTDQSALITIDVDVVVAIDGTISLRATAAETALLKAPSDAKWYVDSVASGLVTRWMYGNVRISN